MPTIPQTEPVLKSYFETGDKPTEDQFVEFVGTMFHNDQVTQGQAAAAEATADAALAAATTAALLKATFVAIGTNYTINAQKNVASVQFVATNSRLRINFTTPFADANYIISVTSNETTDTQLTISNQTTGYFELFFGSYLVGSVTHYRFPGLLFVVIHKV